MKEEEHDKLTTLVVRTNSFCLDIKATCAIL